MKRYSIVTGTVTYAIKGRDILRKKGFKASVERSSSVQSSEGCGYSIIVEENIEQAQQILREAGVKILKITEKQ